MLQALASPSLALPARQQQRLGGSSRAGLVRAPLPSRRRVAAKALGGGGQPRKTLKREDEPEEYWSTKGEREGANPLADPIALIGILAILSPFLILGVAISFGWVDLNGGR